MSSGQNMKILGWATILLSGAILGSMFLPLAQSFKANAEEVSATKYRIERFQAALNRPIEPNRFLEYSKYMHRSDDGVDVSLLAADVQSEILNTLSANQARLVDLNQGDIDHSIKGLLGLTLDLNYEGDLEATLLVLAELGRLQWPALIEQVAMKAQGPVDRPDRRMRASVRLKIWVAE